MDFITIPALSHITLCICSYLCQNLCLNLYSSLIFCRVFLSELMFYELWAAGETSFFFYLLCFMQLLLCTFFSPHHCSTIMLLFQKIERLTLHRFSCKLSLSLCRLSPGSCWPLGIRKYGTLPMEPASPPLLPAL